MYAQEVHPCSPASTREDLRSDNARCDALAHRVSQLEAGLQHTVERLNSYGGLVGSCAEIVDLWPAARLNSLADRFDRFESTWDAWYDMWKSFFDYLWAKFGCNHRIYYSRPRQ